MRPVTLSNGLIVIVIAALLPIGTLSVLQSLAALRYSRTLISNGLVTNALATAARERDPLTISKQVLLTLSGNKAVVAGTAACSGALKTGLGGTPALLNLARSDAQGRVLCSVTPFNPSMSFATESWWQSGIKTPRFTVSAPLYGTISKRRILVGMLPITGEYGKNDGAITAAIDVSWLQRSLANTEMSLAATVAIVDGSGTVLVTSGKSALPRFDVKTGNAKVAEAVAADKVRWMYAIAPLYDKDLYVVYAEPTKYLMATALNQVRIGLILPILAIFMACLAIWIGTNRLVLRWLESLRTLASQFAQGHFAGDLGRYAKAPREIGLLSNDLHSMAKQIETRDQDLKAALDAKTALTHDIHHRVKNNLQIVSSLLNLQTAKVRDPAALEALSQTRARIGALAQIHRLLYEESHDSDHGYVNIASLLQALCSQLRTLHRGQSDIRLSCESASQTVPVNNAVPLTLFAVEAITNAFRHGFPAARSGSVTLHFDVAKGNATLSVSDDGVGFDPKQSTASMGRQLMDAFTAQLDGVMTIVSTPDTGTVVKLIYPVAPE
jgi:two-component sensor histidine kinase